MAVDEMVRTLILAGGPRVSLFSSTPLTIMSSRLVRIGGASLLGLGAAYAAVQATRKEEVPVDVRLSGERGIGFVSCSPSRHPATHNRSHLTDRPHGATRKAALQG